MADGDMNRIGDTVFRSLNEETTTVTQLNVPDNGMFVIARSAVEQALGNYGEAAGYSVST